MPNAAPSGRAFRRCGGFCNCYGQYPLDYLRVITVELQKVLRTAEVAPVRVLLMCAVMLLVLTVAAPGKNCSFSKEFQITHPQILAGALEDPVGGVLSGIELELLSGKKVARHIRTDNLGKYDFGEIPSGKYRIHLQDGANVFCAPKIQCGIDGCGLKARVTVNPKSMVTVY
jgi:hypothetical protein